MRPTYRIRASQIPAWADCQKRASYDQQFPAPPPSRPHVGQVVGNLVHAKVSNSATKMPLAIEWDSQTRNGKELDQQVSQISEYVKNKIENEGLSVVDHEHEISKIYMGDNIDLEVAGRADTILRKGNERSLKILELKTGRYQPRTSWLQSAVYLWMMNQRPNTIKTPYVEAHIVLWTPRGVHPDALPCKGPSWQERPFTPELYGIVELELQSIIRAIEHGPSYNPSSMSCPGCLYTDCPVRYDSLDAMETRA